MSDNSPNTVTVKQDPSKGYASSRVKKQVIGVLAVVVIAILCIVLYVIASKGQHRNTENAEVATNTVTDSRAGLNAALNTAPADTSVIDDRVAQEGQAYKDKQALAPPVKTALEEALEQEWLAIQKNRNQTLLAALRAPVSVTAPSLASPPPSSARVDAEQDAVYRRAKEQVADIQTQLYGTQDALAPPQGSNSGSGQAEKRAFRQQERRHDYLTEGRQAPLSPYELKVGTLIPASLVGAINSDIPGQIIAQISQTVFDSATGSTVLLPQGAKLVGTYDSRVGYGQDRLPVVWTRVNFPDASVLNLGGMDGVDVSGQNGFTGDVDHHYWRIFGNALMLGMISGGTQAAVSDGNSEENSTGEEVANGVVQQFSQTGNQLIQKNLNVQPTITLPNGYEFNIMLTKDVILPPYSS